MKTALYSKVCGYDFEKLFKSKGYAYFTNGEYNLNIIGIRAAGVNITNSFDDILVVIYKTPTGKWTRQLYSITTDPGRYYVINPATRKGTAILVPGQYRGAYKIDRHRGKYEALCQKKPIKVYRDNNKDEIYDYDPKTLEEGLFGINIHKAGRLSTRVDTWSAGCQVFAKDEDFKLFMAFCKKQAALYGNSFTYTLLKEEDLI
ncbi:MAG: hypothetical protein IJG68_02070 [Bacilli bacterium]|nr:hypothetical protein [Bacilli bacterium]